MTAPTLELTVGLSDTLARVVDSARSDWTPEGVENVAAGFALLRRYVATTKRQAQGLLRKGAEAREFVTHFETAVPLLDARLAEFSRLEANGVLRAAPADVAEAFTSVRQEMAACCDFLAGALAAAKAPPPAFDRQKLEQEANADFAAGRFVTYNSPDEMLADLGGGA